MRKILIATASDSTNTHLLRALSRYDVHTCNTGTAALGLLVAIRPDIFILDLALPVIDGLTVLRKSRFRPHIILAMTNLITPTILQSAANAGVQDIILIPCTTHYLVKRLEALIDKTLSLEGLSRER